MKIAGEHCAQIYPSLTVTEEYPVGSHGFHVFLCMAYFETNSIDFWTYIARLSRISLGLSCPILVVCVHVC